MLVILLTYHLYVDVQEMQPIMPYIHHRLHHTILHKIQMSHVQCCTCSLRIFKPLWSSIIYPSLFLQVYFQVYKQMYDVDCKVNQLNVFLYCTDKMFSRKENQTLHSGNQLLWINTLWILKDREHTFTNQCTSVTPCENYWQVVVNRQGFPIKAKSNQKSPPTFGLWYLTPTI